MRGTGQSFLFNKKLAFCAIPIFLFILQTGCGFYRTKEGKNNLVRDPRLRKTSGISFKDVRELVFTPYCTRCHNDELAESGIITDRYNFVINDIELIADDIFTGVMPKDRSLPGDEKELFKNWLKEGAPEYSKPTPDEPTPTPVPSPTPELKATYVSIREGIFALKCLRCHGLGKDDYESAPLEPYEELRKVGGLVVPGKPAASSLFAQIEQGLMPPKAVNLVTEAELKIIKTWIENGAPEK